MEAVPNTYAALLTGPPISTAIIPPRMRPKTTLPVPDILASAVLHMVLSAPIGGSTMNCITMPVTAMPNSGKKRMGLSPSSAFGSLINAFFKKRTIYPAAKPAISAPIKPLLPCEAR